MDGQRHTIIGYGTLTAVWVALLLLTALTVGITRLELGGYRVLGALVVASLKGGLVIAFFMQMKSEGGLLRLFLLIAVVTLAIFIGFTFFDVLYR